jgi:hypothetical protein
MSFVGRLLHRDESFNSDVVKAVMKLSIHMAPMFVSASTFSALNWLVIFELLITSWFGCKARQHPMVAFELRTQQLV